MKFQNETDEEAQQPSHEITEARQYMIDYLDEEFSRHPDVRVRVVPMTKNFGVMVRSETREYFFPFEWADERRYDEIRKLVQTIKDRF